MARATSPSTLANCARRSPSDRAASASQPARRPRQASEHLARCGCCLAIAERDRPGRTIATRACGPLRRFRHGVRRAGLRAARNRHDSAGRGRIATHAACGAASKLIRLNHRIRKKNPATVGQNGTAIPCNSALIRSGRLHRTAGGEWRWPLHVRCGFIPRWRPPYQQSGFQSAVRLSRSEWASGGRGASGGELQYRERYARPENRACRAENRISPELARRSPGQLGQMVASIG